MHMNSNNADNLDRCTHCGKIFNNERTEQWETSAGETIDVEFSNDPYICLDLLGAEMIFCEECYKMVDLGIRYTLDMAEVHFQFGLEYRDMGRFPESLDSLRKALDIKRTADILAEIASVYGKMGDLKLESFFITKH